MNPDLGGMLSHKIWRSAAAVSAVTVLATLIATLPAQAQTETVLYSFCQRKYCYDGTLPSGSLVLNPNGNIYGVTMVGGAIGQGTLYGIKPDGTEEVLHSFGNAPGDGIFPYGLIADSKGDLYGTTKLGGANGLENEGDGTVFKITAGVETILYNFGATSSDGINPQAGVVRDTKGDLYGTTIGGGANGAGTVFKLTPAGVETILHSFAKNGTDGNQADEMLTLDEKENVYGTTSYGGLNNAGIAFEISAAGTYTILYSFGTSASDGAYPFSSLTLDSAGNLYGTTAQGGTNNVGTVFKLTQGDGGAWSETILYNFSSSGGNTPEAGVTLDSEGNLYGTTYDGNVAEEVLGTVFELAPNGTLTTLWNFDGPDGELPNSNLLRDSAGNLYGISFEGGVSDHGTVYEVTP